MPKDAAVIEYSKSHYQWLQQRAAAAANVSSSSSSSAAAAAGVGPDELQLCRAGAAAEEYPGMCWVSGRFWQQDYSVQCFQGR
jgi:hypothetical protein